MGQGPLLSGSFCLQGKTGQRWAGRGMWLVASTRCVLRPSVSTVQSFIGSSWVACVDKEQNFLLQTQPVLSWCFKFSSSVLPCPLCVMLWVSDPLRIQKSFRAASACFLYVGRLNCKSGLQTCRPSCSRYRLVPWLSCPPFLLPLCFAGSTREEVLRGFAYLSKLSASELHPQSLSVFNFESGSC